jgi:hypothetical protein
MPSLPITTASPSMMQECGRSVAIASAIDGKRGVQVITWPAVELHPFAVLAGYDPEAVQLYFMQPDIAGGWLRGFDGKAGRNETERKGHGCPKT